MTATIHNHPRRQHALDSQAIRTLDSLEQALVNLYGTSGATLLFQQRVDKLRRQAGEPVIISIGCGND